MIIQFWEKSRDDLIISDERGQRLFDHIQLNNPKYVDFNEWGYGFIAPGDIKAFIPGTSNGNQWNGIPNTSTAHQEQYRLETKDNKPLSSEEAIKRIREMREKFMEKKK